MTVCVSVAVNDCLVFAADSASTLAQVDPATGNSTILNVYRNGDKVFNLYKGLPISAMTCGMGNIGTASIASIAKRLRQRLMGTDPAWHLDKAKYSIDEVATKAKTYLYDECFCSIKPTPPLSLEFWIGGYPSDPAAGHDIYKITIINGQCTTTRVVADGATGLFVGGQVGPIIRLIAGFDPALPDLMVKGGISQNDAQAACQFFQQQLESQIVMPTMPVKDAIDLADYLVETTTRFFRFLPGADIVGGDTDIAAVTRFEGFKWIRRKHFYPAHLNPLETDHA